eukprot:jgi/Tetstr1/464026/TSEL_008831.t1
MTPAAQNAERASESAGSMLATTLANSEEIIQELIAIVRDLKADLSGLTKDFAKACDELKRANDDRERLRNETRQVRMRLLETLKELQASAAK